MGKESMVCVYAYIYTYTYNGILFRLAKEENPVICNNMDEPRRHHIKWNKSGTERQILLGITYTWNLETSNSEVESRTVVAGIGELGEMER